ncbi:putative FAS1 domain-containing protein [Seiridium cardinale]|uniref:FAS1 domain-containing protein n=1 Tax=Seiridium cardinale TaxID=138064 RepID=A0ABR2XH16_9PEZI
MAHSQAIPTLVTPTVDELEKAFDHLVKELPVIPFDRNNANRTLFQFLEEDVASSSFLKLLKQFPELLALTQDSESEYTLFLPSDSCWKEELDHEKVAPEDVEELVSFHMSPHYVTTEGLLHMPNVPTVLNPRNLNGPQIIRSQASGSGWKFNGSSRIAKGNILCRNGVIHKINHILTPPPDILTILEQNGLQTFRSAIEAVGKDYIFVSGTKGGTVFALRDDAFAALGEDVTHFLFETKSGLPYLRALLQLHLVPDLTFFSNLIWPKNNTGARQTSKDESKKIKGRMTQSLPTALKNSAGEPTNLAVTVVRFNASISLSVNRIANVVGKDFAANNGVVHVIDRVLLPRGNGDTPSDGEMPLERFKDIFFLDNL